MSVLEALVEGGIGIPANCGGIGSCGHCRIQLVENSQAMAATEPEQRYLTVAEIGQGVRLACQVKPQENLAIRILFESASGARGWRNLEQDELPFVDFAGSTSADDRPYGLAIDFGTTCIRLSLWDCTRGQRLAALAGNNPQAAFGSDVLTRLSANLDSAEAAKRMEKSTAATMALAISELAARAAVGLSELGRLGLVGNTAMLALLGQRNIHLLLDPDQWQRAIDCRPVDLAGLRDSWGLAQSTEVEFAQPC